MLSSSQPDQVPSISYPDPELGKKIRLLRSREGVTIEELAFALKPPYGHRVDVVTGWEAARVTPVQKRPCFPAPKYRSLLNDFIENPGKLRDAVDAVYDARNAQVGRPPGPFNGKGMLVVKLLVDNPLGLTQGELKELSGVSGGHVSKTLRKLRAGGFVAMGRREGEPVRKGCAENRYRWVSERGGQMNTNTQFERWVRIPCDNSLQAPDWSETVCDTCGEKGGSPFSERNTVPESPELLELVAQFVGEEAENVRKVNLTWEKVTNICESCFEKLP